MANTLLLKRSAVANKVPTTTDLALGELGLNTYDGKLYLKKDSGTPAIVEVAVKDSSGNLGIGTSPSARLHVLSTTEQFRAAYDASNRFTLTVASTGNVGFDSVGTAPGFSFADPVVVYDGTLASNVSNSIASLGADAAGSRIDSYYATGSYLRFRTSATDGSVTERLRIDSSGNVAVGTTSASARLHLVSTTEQLRVGYDASNYVKLAVGSTGAVTIDAVGSGAAFQFSDNVGIGGAPSYALDVTGDINASGALRFAGAAGTAGQVLTSTGTTAPSWSNPTTLGTSVATTSGTNKDFTIPAWARQVVVTLAGVSFATTAAALRIQLGDAGGIETSGYTGACAKHASTSAYSNLSAGFDQQGTYVVANTISGRIELTLVDEATFTWACHAVLGEGGTAQVWTISGHKALSAALTTVRVTSVAGTSAFDAGTVNVAYH